MLPLHTLYAQPTNVEMLATRCFPGFVLICDFSSILGEFGGFFTFLRKWNSFFKEFHFDDLCYLLSASENLKCLEEGVPFIKSFYAKRKQLFKSTTKR